MKIVVFSDIHGNQYAFREFQKDMERIQPELIVFLGDIFGYYYGQEEILTAIRESKYQCLLGNHDKYYLDMLDGKEDVERLCECYGSSYSRNISCISEKNLLFLGRQKPYWECQIEGIRIGAFHGSPDDPLNGRIYPDSDISKSLVYEDFDFVFIGHTHHKMKKILKNTIVINPGSLGQQRDGKGCSYLIFDTDSLEIGFHIVKYPVANLLTEIKEKDPKNNMLIEVLLRNT